MGALIEAFAQRRPRTLARGLHRIERWIDEDLFKNITHTFSIVAKRR
jgi:hypothetical protein